MVHQIIVYASYVVGIFLFFRYIVKVKFVINDHKIGAQHLEIGAQKVSQFLEVKDFLEAEIRKIESHRQEQRYQICSDFSNAIAPLLDGYCDIDKIVKELKSIKERVLSATDPFMIHDELREMLHMMDIVDKLYALTQEAQQTRSQKKKLALAGEYVALRESLKGYSLPHHYGELWERENFMADCTDDLEDNEEAENLEAEEDVTHMIWSTDDALDNAEITQQIDAMFHNIPTNTLRVSPS